MECLNSVIGRSCRVLPGALDLQEDSVGVISKQQTSDQTKHPASDTSAVPSSSNHTYQRRDDVEHSANSCAEQITPHPVDHHDLFVQLHHEDAKEDHGKDHLTDGHSRVTSIHRGGVADDDDETDQDFSREDKTFWRLHVTFQPLHKAGTRRGCISHTVTAKVLFRLRAGIRVSVNN